MNDSLVGGLEPDFPFRDCWLRLEWADLDGQAFDREIAAFRAAKPYDLLLKHDGQSGKGFIHRRIEPAEERTWHDRFGRVLGAFLDDNRAALNYFAYRTASLIQQAQPTATTDLAIDAVEFPIFSDRELFRKKNRIKKFPDQYRNAFEAVQPYDGRYPGLWMLHELAREYRHRVIHPLALFPTSDDVPTVTTTEGAITSTDLTHADGPLKDDTEVLSFTIEGFHGHGRVYADFAVTVGIDHPMCARRDAIEVANEIAGDVAKALAELRPTVLGLLR